MQTWQRPHVGFCRPLVGLTLMKAMRKTPGLAPFQSCKVGLAAELSAQGLWISFLRLAT